MQIRELLKGAMPAVMTPTAILLVVVASEKLQISGPVQVTLIASIFFGSFAYLVKTQFARRRWNRDVANSFLLAEALGLLVLAFVLFLMWL